VNSGLLKKMIGYVLFFSGIVYLYSAMKRLLGIREVTVLMYHRVVDSDDTLDQDVITANRDIFRMQVEYLSTKCNIINFEELGSYRNSNIPIPKRSVIITFDDGYRDNYEIAYPILKENKASAMIALATGFIGKKDLFWWDKLSYCVHQTKASEVVSARLGKLCLHDKEKAISRIQQSLKEATDQVKKEILDEILQKLNIPILLKNEVFLTWKDVREMSMHRISYAAHTVTHPILTRISLSEAKKEIKNSKQDIEREINREVNVFTYPNGKKEDMSEGIDKFLKEHGFKFCLSTQYGTNRITTNMFRLNRVGIERDDNMVLFKVKVRGFGKIFASLYEKLKKKS
jgi:peptidoglycan/xylan/chitin deacetylase (PgdA/CDA1 family)